MNNPFPLILHTPRLKKKNTSLGLRIRVFNIRGMGLTWISHQLTMIIINHESYPLVMTNIAIENCPFIVGLPIKDGDFP